MSEPTPFDYDADPARFLANREATRRFAAEDVHEAVAARLAAGRLTPVVDVGSGEGTLAQLLAQSPVRVVSLDRSATLLAGVEDPRVRASAEDLPFRDDSVAAVTALWMLYHLAEPQTAVAEAWRVLRPGGAFVACAASRFNDPEFRGVLAGWGKPSTFDAEVAEHVVGTVFDEVEVERWNEKALRLPDADAVALYLRGRGLSEEHAQAAAATVSVPLDVTKRGVLLWATKT